MTGDWVEVELTSAELFAAGNYGVSRQIHNLRKGYKDAHGLVCKTIGFDIHAHGCVTEMAVAKYRNVYWCPLKFGATDVHDVEVRSVDTASKRLRLHRSDHGDAPYILVLIDPERLRGERPVVILRGWLYARDGWRDEWWADPEKSGRPAFWVPNNFLRPMSELPPVNREPIAREVAV